LKVLFLILTLTTFCTSVNAQVQRHDFTLTGDGGEVGTGFFTWEDTDPVNGSNLPLAKVLSGSITVTGGATPAGSQTFPLANWTLANLNQTPNFVIDINFSANNGVATLSAVNFYTANTSWGATLTFIPGATAPIAAPVAPTPVPTLSTWGLFILSALMGFIGISKRNKKQI